MNPLGPKGEKEKRKENTTLPLKACIHGVCQMIKKKEEGSYVRLKIHVADSPSSPFHQTVGQLHDGLSWDLV